ncbi:MAG: YfhO family protein [Oscillospiraceae bacterium]|nr:YfhO family protein [Oscillospiraceae bacterium]
MKSSPLKKKKWLDRLPLLLAFLMPFAIVCIVFTVDGVYPCGDNMILAHDEWHQYYPFFSAFREKLLSGGSMQYTWNVGMGTGYASLFAYYLASPLNWLCVLVPASLLTEFFALLTVVKIACAGLFMALFLRIVYRRNDLSIAFFGLMYAFCSWVCGYYWNNIWLDTFALLPLLVAGTVCLLRDGKFRLYVITLALSLWCNYYIAYFCCIFVLLTFIVYCIVCWQGWKNFLRRFLRIGVCTLIGVALAAALLIPTLKAMGITNSAKSKDVSIFGLNIASGVSSTVPEGESLLHFLWTQTLPGVWDAAKQIFTNLMPAPNVTKMEGLPNVYCGLSALILAICFCCSGKIRLREKLCSVFLLLFLFLSFIFRYLDYVWHGFHFPNMLPYRFSFLFSFVTICMAFRAFTLMDSFKKWYLFFIVPLAGLLIWNAWGAEEPGQRSVILGLVVLAGMIAFFLIYGKRKWRRTVALTLLAAIISCEMILCFVVGSNKVAFTSRSGYPKDGAAVQTLLEKANQLEEGKTLFWRTEATNTHTLNDGALNNYNGVTIFTSSANVNFNRFSRSLGTSSWPGSNRFLYYESSPFINAMCGIKYLLDRDGQYRDTQYNSLIATEGSTNLLRNDYFISVGFMTDSALADFSALEDKYNPIWEQNEMFALATGVHEPLYVPVQHSELRHSDENVTLEAGGTSGTQYSFNCTRAAGRSSLSVVYRAEADGLYCATTNFTNVSSVSCYHNGVYLFDRNIKARSMFSLGWISAGDEITLVYFVDQGESGVFSADVELMDDYAFRRGWAELADEAWELTDASDTKLSGIINARRDGLFYTSVPYEPGWTATVDGEEVELAATFDPSNKSVKLTDAVIAFPLTAGMHSITLRYTAPGLTLGCLISAAALLTFIALLWLHRKKEFVLFPDPPKEKPEGLY